MTLGNWGHGLCSEEWAEFEFHAMNEEKILVVDDSLVVVKTLQLKLSAAGFQVTTALDGSEALAAVRRDRPDLIVLDINFPPDVTHGGGIAWDGFLLMQWLGRMEEGRDIPIVIITGQDPGQYRDRAAKLGARAFFTKPVDNDGLIEVIRETLALNAKPNGP
jgi:CheY-like chemotaxis protein